MLWSGDKEVDVDVVDTPWIRVGTIFRFRVPAANLTSQGVGVMPATDIGVRSHILYYQMEV